MGTHSRPPRARWSPGQDDLYRARHGLERARHSLSRAQSQAWRGVSRARHGVSEAGLRLARARRHLSRSAAPRSRSYRIPLRSSLPTPAEALLPWGVVLIGIGFMIGLMVAVFVVPLGQTPGPAQAGHELASPTAPPAPPPATGDPEGNGKDEYALRDVAAVRYSPTPAPESPSPSPTPSQSPSPEPTTPPADPDLTGTYKVDESHWDVFIGKVVIANTSAQERDWRVELAFSSDVGKLNTFWVDGTPQPTMQQSGDRYVFTSTVPVPGRSWVVLKVHFDRRGGNILPTTCTVNDVDCAIDR